MFREAEGALHERTGAQGRAVGLRAAPAQAIRLSLQAGRLLEITFGFEVRSQAVGEIEFG